MIPLRIDRNSPIPLYYQLQEQLREAIRDGRLAPRSALPTEPELADQIGVSRFTLRQAIEDLVREGLLRRERGRGTFVTEPVMREAAGLRCQFGWQAAVKGAGWRTRRVSSTRGVPPPDVGRALGLDRGGAALEVVRIRLLGRQPAGVETIYLPAALAVEEVPWSDLDDRELVEQLEQRHRLRISHAQHVVRPGLLDEETADLLGQPVGSPVLSFERRTFAGSTAVELRHGVVVGSHAEVSTTLPRAELSQP